MTTRAETRRVLVHLVHGTWPRGLPAAILPVLGRLRRSPLWFESGSDFRRNLEGEGIEFRAFEWSGANSVRARAVAAEKLRSALRLGRAEAPDAVQVVIAHSHGGNVVVQALSDPGADGLADGIATLGTPFLYVGRRTIQGHETLSVAFAQAVGFVLLAVMCALVAIPGAGLAGPERSALPWTTKWLILSVMVVAIALGFLLGTGWKVLRNRIEDSTLRTVRVGLPLRILRTPRDEATLVLALAQIADTVLESVWRLLRPIVRSIVGSVASFNDMRRRGLTVLCGILLISGAAFSLPFLARGVASSGSLWAALREPWVSVGSQGGSLFLVCLGRGLVLLRLVPGVLALLVFSGIDLIVVLCGLSLAPFGWELVFCGLTLEVTSEPTPPGSAYPVETVRLERQELDRVGMRHSLHTLPSVQKRLRRWLRMQRRRRPFSDVS